VFSAKEKFLGFFFTTLPPKNPSSQTWNSNPQRKPSQSILHYILLLKTIVVVGFKIRQILHKQVPFPIRKEKSYYE
jgi:hypothetical protein